MGKSRRSWRGLAVACALSVAAVVSIPAAALGAGGPQTGGVTNVTSTSAVLHGIAADGGAGSTWSFQYGTTTNYGQSTPPILVNPSAEDVTAAISGLLPGTTYHYRLTGAGPYLGENADGSDATFTTLAAPGSIATTGQATGVTGTSAELNGVVNTTDPAPHWFFQYGQTRTYGHATSVHSIGQGLTLVSVKVTGLKPRTFYHFRLVVQQSTAPTVDGRDGFFKTAQSYGHATVRSHRLKIRHGAAMIPFGCTGPAGSVCDGQVSLKTRARINKHLTVIGCGRGRLAMTAVRRRTIALRLGPRCGSLLHRAPHGNLRATLTVIFSSHQPRLQTHVTLLKS